MSTGEKWTLGTILGIISIALAIAGTIFTGGVRAQKAISMAEGAKEIARGAMTKADVACDKATVNREAVVELKADVKYIREGIEEIRRAVRNK